MAMSLSLNDIKKDMKELVAIINEECVPTEIVTKVVAYCGMYDNNKNMRLDKIRELLKRESDVAYITDLENRKISDRFVSKIIDVVSRYEKEELDMLIKCTSIVLSDMTSKEMLDTNTRK